MDSNLDNNNLVPNNNAPVPPASITPASNGSWVMLSGSIIANSVTLAPNTSLTMAPGSSITTSNIAAVTGEEEDSVTYFEYRDDASETVTCPAANQLDDLSGAMSNLFGQTVVQSNNPNGTITFSTPTEVDQVEVSGATAAEEAPDA